MIWSTIRRESKLYINCLRDSNEIYPFTFCFYREFCSLAPISFSNTTQLYCWMHLSFDFFFFESMPPPPPTITPAPPFGPPPEPLPPLRRVPCMGIYGGGGAGLPAVCWSRKSGIRMFATGDDGLFCFDDDAAWCRSKVGSMAAAIFPVPSMPLYLKQ